MKNKQQERPEDYLPEQAEKWNEPAKISNVGYEFAIIARCVKDPEALGACLDILKAEDFFNRLCETAFSVLRTMEFNAVPINILTFKEKISDFPRVKPEQLKELLAALDRAYDKDCDVVYYARQVRKYSKRRELMRFCKNTFFAAGKVDDVYQVIDDVTEQFLDLVMPEKGKSSYTVSELSPELFADLKRKFENPKNEITGFQTGYDDFDNIIDGFAPQSLNILAARPSMGKTALALNIALQGKISLYDNDVPTGILFFSLEMSKDQIMNRLLSIFSNVPLSHITKGQFSKDEFRDIEGAAEKMRQSDISIETAGDLTVSRLRAIARRHYLQRKILASPLRLIVVDYLQLLHTEKDYGASRVNEVAEISRTLKTVAVECNCPVLALSQLSRDVEKRNEHKPRMSDIRDSGTIEQDADTVTLLFREDYYADDNDGKKASKKDFYGHSLASENESDADLEVAKNRNGRTGKFKLRFLREYTKFIAAGTKY